MECHHIVHESEGGPDTLDNCIPVCFDCHADMTSYDFEHPKGTKYRPKELRAHRDKWFATVAAGGTSNTTSGQRTRDKKVFEGFREAVPYEPLIMYFSIHSFEDAFDWSVFEPLRRYEFYSENPSHCFSDVHLEALRLSFLSAARKFLSYLSVNTWILPNSARLARIPLEWRETNFVRLMRTLDELAERYSEFTKTYAALVKECEERLPD